MPGSRASGAGGCECVYVTVSLCACCEQPPVRGLPCFSSHSFLFLPFLWTGEGSV